MTGGVTTPGRVVNRFGGTSPIPNDSRVVVGEVSTPLTPASRAKVKGGGKRRVSSQIVLPMKSKSYNELKKGEMLMMDETNRLKERVGSLTQEIKALKIGFAAERSELIAANAAQTSASSEQYRDLERAMEQVKQQNGAWEKRNAELEFSCEERRISERDDFDDRLSQLQARAEAAEALLERARVALELAGCNAISMKKITDRQDEWDDNVEADTKALSMGIIEAENAAEALLAQIKQMGTGADGSERDLSPDAKREHLSRSYDSPVATTGNDEDMFFSPVQSF